MGGEKPLGQMLPLIPTACLGRDVRLYSYSSDVKHLQQHLGPVKVNNQTLLNPGLMPGYETVNCAEKARVRQKLPGEKKSVLSRSFQRPLGFASSNNEVSRELAGWI